MVNMVINPASKSGHGLEMWKELEDWLLKHSIEYEAFLSKGPGDVTRIPVFRRSTMKIPTFSNFLIRLKSLIYPEKLDFIGKFNVLTGHFFIENFFDMLYNNSTT